MNLVAKRPYSTSQLEYSAAISLAGRHGWDG